MFGKSSKGDDSFCGILLAAVRKRAVLKSCFFAGLSFILASNLIANEKEMNSSGSIPSNRLAQEKSPYLLQHASNPVDWYPWGPEVFAKAKKEDKLVFLSIGYSTCHWCHVMAHESFESKEVAHLLNENFVSIKVDREERPDIDQLYMSAVQAMTGSGGWPLTVFLTPDGRPVTGGTYFPPEDRWGRPGMKTILPRLAKAWKENRKDIEGAAEQMSGLLRTKPGLSLTAGQGKGPKLDEKIFQKAFEQFESRFDPHEGGFGGAPKFPRSHDLSFLLRYWLRTKENLALQMVQTTLDRMARGGMYDQLGGGFHRYSTDEHWLVPHFEKMLYDQAILAKTYLEAYQATKAPFYADVARDIFCYVLRDMTDPQGGFYSAEDADSEGGEGKFYVWRPEEIVRILGPETGRLFNEFYGVTDQGNFEHATSILHVAQDLESFAKERKLNLDGFEKTLAEVRAKLFEMRKKRIHPHKDDKILTAWNGMMISALALGTQILGDPSYAVSGAKAADFILNQMQEKGRLLRRFRDGEAGILAYQEDYAFFALGLLDLYETTFDIRWLLEAKRLCEQMIRIFWDEEHGGFYYTGADGEALIARSKEYYDGAMPSGNSIAALLLLRLNRMLGNSSLEERTEALIQSNVEPLSQYPMAYPQLLIALDFALSPSREIVIAGDRGAADFKKMIQLIHSQFQPRRVLIHHPTGQEGSQIESLAGYVKNQPAIDGKATAYVCENHVCKLPAVDLKKLEAYLVS